MKIEGDYAIIETVEEAAVLHTYTEVYKLHDVYRWEISSHVGASRSDVLEAITPKDGDAVFWGYNDNENCIDTPWDTPWYEISPIKEHKARFAIKANALTIGATVGELRELLTWCTGDTE